ncbi:hypothetical protein P8936_03015 [Edaphobacter paludis]|uniref:Uncharacterized protein n=1 Tax=Edaphobacter paludis TaxID=3035702 RepID=A0AAU7DBG1_9BACT
MNRTNLRMLGIAYELLAREASTGEPSDLQPPAVVRVAEKLRGPISMLVGATGFRALLTRSLSLARAQVPALSAIQVKPDGALEWNTVGNSARTNGEAVKPGAILITELLGLLSHSIGEAMTLRLLNDAWPDLPAIKIDSRGKTT